MSFIVQSRYVLLTYAQCGELDPFRVMDAVGDLGGECIIGKEHHADGGLHLHVFCDFGRKLRSRKVDVFDVDGIHPNISCSYGTPEKGYDYAIKDGDVVCGGLGRPISERRGSGGGKTHHIWSQITSAGCAEDFWSLVFELDPKAGATSYTQLSKFCEWRFKPDPPLYVTPGGCEFIGGDLDGRDCWVSQSGVGSGEPLIG